MEKSGEVIHEMTPVMHSEALPVRLSIRMKIHVSITSVTFAVQFLKIDISRAVPCHITAQDTTPLLACLLWLFCFCCCGLVSKYLILIRLSSTLFPPFLYFDLFFRVCSRIVNILHVDVWFTTGYTQLQSANLTEVFFSWICPDPTFL
jgi:hypothetical protein